MKTMTIQTFRKNYKNLPIEAKMMWTASFVIAMAAITMIGLEFFGKIGDHHLMEMILCNISLWTNIVLMHKYKSYIQEER